jgi:hypothetical protein
MIKLFIISFSIQFLVDEDVQQFPLCSFTRCEALGDFNLCIHNKKIVAIYHVITEEANLRQQH